MAKIEGSASSNSYETERACALADIIYRSVDTENSNTQAMILSEIIAMLSNTVEAMK